MAYSLEPVSQGCYPGTTVLANKLNIRDKATLNEAEALSPTLTPPSWSIARWKASLILPITRRFTIFSFLSCMIGQDKSVQ